jgi:type II secretory pathway component PulM
MSWKTTPRERKLRDAAGFAVFIVIVLVFIVFPLIIVPLQHSLREGKWADGWTQVFRAR